MHYFQVALVFLLLPPSFIAFPRLWDNCELLDMSYDISDETIFWPSKLLKKFQQKSIHSGMTAGGFYLNSNSYCSNEHYGTHMDAPKHILASLEQVAGKHTADQVPLTQLVGEACVIDIPDKEKMIRSDYRITIEDVKEWEKSNGDFHKGCIVLVRTGQEKLWKKGRNAYLGSDNPDHTDAGGTPDTLHYPGITPEAVQWIMEHRGMKAIGIDTISLDAGQAKLAHPSVHTVVLGANVPGFENVMNLEKMPKRGATVIALPAKFKDASGSPTRIMAFGWRGHADPCRVDYTATNGSFRVVHAACYVIYLTLLLPCLTLLS